MRAVTGDDLACELIKAAEGGAIDDACKVIHAALRTGDMAMATATIAALMVAMELVQVGINGAQTRAGTPEGGVPRVSDTLSALVERLYEASPEEFKRLGAESVH